MQHGLTHIMILNQSTYVRRYVLVDLQAQRIRTRGSLQTRGRHSGRRKCHCCYQQKCLTLHETRAEVTVLGEVTAALWCTQHAA